MPFMSRHEADLLQRNDISYIPALEFWDALIILSGRTLASSHHGKHVA